MEYFGSGVEVVPEGVGQLGTEFIGHAAGGAFDLVDQALEIGAGAGDGNDAQGRCLPGDSFVELGDGDIKVVAQLVLEGADDLTPVFEGLGVFDTKLEGELGDGHVLADDLGCAAGWLHSMPAGLVQSGD